MHNQTTTQYEKTRQHERKPFVSSIDYFMNVSEGGERRAVHLKGRTVDICEAGIGIETDYPVAPGHTLWFHDELVTKGGIVRWSAKVNGHYRAGILLTGETAYDLPPDELTAQPSIAEGNDRHLYFLEAATDEFNGQLEEIERRSQQAKESQESLMDAVRQAVANMRAATEEFERAVGHEPAVLKSARVRFREKTNQIFSKCYYNRARTWPQGYPGDHKTLESIYRNTPQSSGIGYYLDRYCLSTALAVAVRERRVTLREILRKELDRRESPRILDIACGSCREVFELAPEIERSGAHVTCLDFDSDALDFAAGRLAYSGISEGQIEFRKYNALKMVSHERNLKEFGLQDVIYSVGFYDYLQDDVLIRLLNALYSLLAPGGTFITSFKDCRRYPLFDNAWLLDWDAFLQRTEDEMWSLLDRAGIPRSSVSSCREASGVIVFLLATK